MATKQSFSWRGDFQKEDGEAEFRGRRVKIETYAGHEHCRGGFGGRVVDQETAQELAYSEWYENRSSAARWIKIALGLGTLLVILSQVIR